MDSEAIRRVARKIPLTKFAIRNSASVWLLDMERAKKLLLLCRVPEKRKNIFFLELWERVNCANERVLNKKHTS